MMVKMTVTTPAAAGVVTVIVTIIVATFALRMFARVFRFEEAGV